MPFTQNNALLGGMGLACILGGVRAYKKKATTPFKVTTHPHYLPYMQPQGWGYVAAPLGDVYVR
jgi:hypothetical protein